MKWWTDNWDKVLTAIVSVILSGVVGFFSAVISIRSEMSDLKERTVKLETQVASNLTPKLQVVDDHTKTITQMQQNLNEIKTQTDISINTNKLLDLRIEQVRAETISNLKGLIEEAKKQPSSTK